MAWTTPTTIVNGDQPGAVSEPDLDQDWYDNLQETMPGKATAAGQMLVAIAANAIAPRAWYAAASVATAETTTSTSFTDLATAGPSATLPTGTTVLVHITALVANNTGNRLSRVGIDVSGSTTVAAQVADSLQFESSNANDQARYTHTAVLTGLTAGSNTFKMQYNVSAGTGTFTDRKIIVQPLN